MTVGEANEGLGVRLPCDFRVTRYLVAIQHSPCHSLTSSTFHSLLCAPKSRCLVLMFVDLFCFCFCCSYRVARGRVQRRVRTSAPLASTSRRWNCDALHARKAHAQKTSMKRLHARKPAIAHARCSHIYRIATVK